MGHQQILCQYGHVTTVTIIAMTATDSELFKANFTRSTLYINRIKLCISGGGPYLHSINKGLKRMQLTRPEPLELAKYIQRNGL